MDATITIPTALFLKMRIALNTANEVLSKHRLAGTDQNPKGVHDIVGAVVIQANKIEVRP